MCEVTLVQPQPSRKLFFFRDESPEKVVEPDFDFQVLFKGHANNLLPGSYRDLKGKQMLYLTLCRALASMIQAWPYNVIVLNRRYAAVKGVSDILANHFL